MPYKAFVLCVLVAVLAACAPQGKSMTAADITASGTARFEAPPAKVFAAVQSALKSQGYEIASAEASKGMIKTDRKIIRTEAVGNQYAAQATAYYRQYVVKLHSDGKATVVEAEPRVFQGDLDLSDRDVWDMDGPSGEKKLWAQLFRDVNEAL